MFFDWNEFFKRLDVYNNVNIPENAVKTEEVLEKDGLKTVTTTYKAPGFVYTVTSTEPLVREQNVLEQLKKALGEAVASEDYLKAAELKKEIELVESKSLKSGK